MPQPAFETLCLEKRGAADWLTLCRPDRLNAMNERMIGELADYFGARCNDRATRVIVLRAEGRAFCAGLDLKEMAGLVSEFDLTARLAFQQRLSGMILAMRRCPQPIVCLIQGAASGGGFALAVASDIRYCTPDARMNAAFIKVGLTGCDVGMSYLLPRLVGASVATELLMTGAFLDAVRAERLGFVSRIVPSDELEIVGQRMAQLLLQADPVGLALTKQGLQVGIATSSLEIAIANEDRQQIMMSGEKGFRTRLCAFLMSASPAAAQTDRNEALDGDQVEGD